MLQKLATNSASLLASDFLNRASIFVVAIFAANYLELRALGQLSLAIVLFYVFHSISVFGLRILIVRRVAKNHKLDGAYLVNGSAVIAATSIISLGILLLFLLAMGYPRDTTGYVMLLAIGIIPAGISATCEAVFLGRERMLLVAAANAPVSIFRMGAAFWILSQGYDLATLIAMLVGCRIAICMLELLFVAVVIRPDLSPVRPQVCTDLLCSSFTFFLVDSCIAACAAVSVVLLSKIHGEEFAGIFHNVAQMMLPLALINRSILAAIFPQLCRRFNVQTKTFPRITEPLLMVLFAVSIPGAVGLVVLAEPILSFVYPNKPVLVEHAYVLQLMALTAVSLSITGALGMFLWAGNLERKTLVIVIINLLVNVAAGVVLISLFGILGAALALIIASIVTCGLHFYFTRNLLPKIHWFKVVWQPLIASAVMALALILIPVTHTHVLLLILMGMASYGIIMIGLQFLWLDSPLLMAVRPKSMS